jgi:hypothetical protein
MWLKTEILELLTVKKEIYEKENWGNRGSRGNRKEERKSFARDV